MCFRIHKSGSCFLNQIHVFFYRSIWKLHGNYLKPTKNYVNVSDWYNVGPPSDVRWFINPLTIVTIVIGTINHFVHNFSSHQDHHQVLCRRPGRPSSLGPPWSRLGASSWSRGWTWSPMENWRPGECRDLCWAMATQKFREFSHEKWWFSHEKWWFSIVFSMFTYWVWWFMMILASGYD